MLRAFGQGQRRVEEEAEAARLQRLDHLQNVAVRRSPVTLNLAPSPTPHLALFVSLDHLQNVTVRHATMALIHTLTQTYTPIPTRAVTLTLTQTPINPHFTVTSTFTLTPATSPIRCDGSPNSVYLAPSVHGSRPTRCSTASSEPSVARRDGWLARRRCAPSPPRRPSASRQPRP